MSAFERGGLAPVAAVACAAVSCVLSGAGADRLLVVPFASGCVGTATYYVVIDQPSFTLAGVAVALILVVSSWVGTRFLKSEPQRLHLRYLLAFGGFLIASALWAVSAAYVRDACTAPRFPVGGVPRGKDVKVIAQISLPQRFRSDGVLGQLLTRMAADGVAQGEGIWILYDHDGRVVCAGEERFGAVGMSDTIEARYPGTRTADSRASILVRQDGQAATAAGKPVELRSVWLAEGSPTPGCAADRNPPTVTDPRRP